MSSRPIFFDSSGTRLVWFKRLAMALAGVLTVTGTLFVLSLLVVPFVVPGRESATARLRHLLPFVPKRPGHLFYGRQRMALLAQIDAEKKTHAAPAAARLPIGGNTPIVAAFYAPWQNTGLASFRSQARNLTHVIPLWLGLDTAGRGLELKDFDLRLNRTNRDIIAIARQNHLAIEPLLSNAVNGNFDPARASKLLHSPAAQVALAEKIALWLKQNDFQGLNLDFENLYPADYVLLPRFVRILSTALHRKKRELSTELEAGIKDPILVGITAPSDFVVVMAYDQHYSTGKPGPIAAWKWSAQLVQKVARLIPTDKMVLGIGNYAYDWTRDSTEPAQALSYQSALLTAEESEGNNKPSDIIDFDSDALNATFEYEEGGKSHEVWILDAVSAYNQWHTAQQMDLRGGALWELGTEDPSIWNFFRRQPPATLQPRSLETIQFPYEIANAGQGEVLRVTSEPKAGQRKLELDESSGLITDQVYQSFPASFVIQHSGFSRRSLALTFDDGPDPTWTPQILDVLKESNVHATFFMLGSNIERFRPLVRRVWNEGHDIGSHTFTHPNLGAVSPRRVELELNATQRAIQSVTGHSTRLFRPPYNADANPQTGEEVRPIVQSSEMGYITVGEFIDPQDWNPIKVDIHGKSSPRTVEDIVSEVERGAAERKGNVILMHDAGGDRQKTVDALREIIPALRNRGFRFVTTSQLLGQSRATLMPVLTGHQRVVAIFDRLVFNTVFGIEWLLAVGFVAAILLGIGRVALILPLALASRRREKHALFDPDFQPFVSVLIAGYNEENVIERTIRSILASDYPGFEVIVVDDGSRDDTAAVVQKTFAGDPRVRLLQQPNGGKATALNHALTMARGEVFVAFDADTQVASDSIALLVRHFANEKVVAVAGNVKVGNQLNILTRWQAIEYITSQNLDRRAQSYINSITVVPGAIGAWRAGAVRAVGGYLTDTLAEDMDLTWRLHRAGGIIANETSARAYTEAPDTLGALFKQRFRWAYGTLQCLYKHRKALGRHGWFGKMALPSVWIFQFLLQWLAPCVDLQLFVATAAVLVSYVVHLTAHSPWQADPDSLQFLQKTGFFYALFFAIELAGAFTALRLERENTSHLWFLFWQRFVYRQMLYVVIWKATWSALVGFRQGWGELARKGTVSLPAVLPNQNSASGKA